MQLANGKRDNESRTANACLSSEGFFNETVAFARLMFDHYDLPVVSVMPHDGFTHCQCDDCRDQITLDRGPSGLSSDYVWNFVVRVANELAKTHPDKKVFCGAYSSYRLPPLTIDKLPDNVLVQITNGRPIRELDDEVHESTAELRAPVAGENEQSSVGDSELHAVHQSRSLPAAILAARDCPWHPGVPGRGLA